MKDAWMMIKSTKAFEYIIIIAAVLVGLISTGSCILNTVIYSMAMVPLAIVLGRNTSSISDYIGEKRGGLISATAGNIPELLMSLWSIRYGMVSMAKAGIIGAVITNMLLALGISVFLGGVKFREQKFNKIIARTNMNMLLLVIATVMIISYLNGTVYADGATFAKLSLMISVVLIIVYILGLVFSLYTHGNLFLLSSDKNGLTKRSDGRKECTKIILSIAVITLALYFISNRLIDNINDIVRNYNVSQEFIGIILIPLLGSFGENASSIVCALNNKVNISLETAIGSSIQITMFVMPVIVIFSYIIGSPVTLVFSMFQIIIMAISLAMAYFVFQDGKTYWLEGAILIAVYIVITMAYYFVI